MKKYSFCLLFILIQPIILQGQGKLYSIEEKPGNIIPPGVYVTNEDSVKVELRSLIDKPTLLAFVYYRCPGLCSPLMSGIAEMMDKCNLVPGKDYQVVCISISSKEHPQLAMEKKKNQMKVMKKHIPSEAWHFFTTDSTSIATLTAVAGFEFEQVGNDFIHSAGLIIVAPSGKITQYLLGTFFLPHEVEWAVNNARQDNAVASRIKEARYCYPSEPKTRLITKMAILVGVAILVLIELILVVVLIRRKMQILK